MKIKVIFSSLLLLFFYLSSNAQNMDFGVKGGLNLASINGDSENISTRTSFHAGVVFELKFSDKFSFQPEIIFSEQGAESNYSEQVGSESIKYESVLRTDYINIPLMAKYYLTEGLDIELGPYVGFLLSASNQNTIDGVLQG